MQPSKFYGGDPFGSQSLQLSGGGYLPRTGGSQPQPRGDRSSGSPADDRLQFSQPLPQLLPQPLSTRSGAMRCTGGSMGVPPAPWGSDAGISSKDIHPVSGMLQKLSSLKEAANNDNAAATQEALDSLRASVTGLGSSFIDLQKQLQALKFQMSGEMAEHAAVLAQALIVAVAKLEARIAEAASLGRSGAGLPPVPIAPSASAAPVYRAAMAMSASRTATTTDSMWDLDADATLVAGTSGTQEFAVDPFVVDDPSQRAIRARVHGMRAEQRNA